MKNINKILILTIVTLATILASEVYFANQYLFNLSSSEKPLTQEQMKTLDTPYPELNLLIRKFDVVRIEPWLKSARDSDKDGDVYLNRIYRLTTSADQLAPLAIANEIASSANAIMHAEPEPVMKITGSIPNDPGIGLQWYLRKAQVVESWNLWDLEAGEVPGDRNIVVAVVDDGVEYTHPDLWKNIWINQDEIPEIYFDMIDTDQDGFITAEEAVNFVGDVNGDGKTDLKDVLSQNSLITDGIDNDGDGYIDNIIGWDCDEFSGSGDDDNNPMVTNNSHGTHVAGLVGATTNNGIGVASAAYNISIMAVKATGDNIGETINTGWDGILFAAHAGADIINCSWGGPGYSSYAQGVVNIAANTYGSLIVAAAGNGENDGLSPSNTPHYPSGYDNVVSVTAVNSQDHFSWASYGEADPVNNFYGVDISAPGENMYSTYLTTSGSYVSLMGTSMASPFVASCFALLKSVYPDSSNDWLVDRMLNNTDPIDHLNPDYAGQLGTGRVNILKALVSDRWPSLSILDVEENITVGDADNILNPGETVNLFIELKNDTGWTEASGVQGILRTKEEGVVILDSVATWGPISADSSQYNLGDGFLIQFSDSAKVKKYNFNLKILSNQSDDYTYRTNLSFNIDLSLEQQGFPFYTQTAVEVGVLSADVNGNGKEEIIFIDKSGDLYIVDCLGDTLPNFPISLGSQPGGIALADIDLDDTLEIVITLFDKQIQVYDVTGKHKWQRSTDSFITGIPAIGNLDDDPELEIVFGSYDKNIYALNHDGTDVEGFPYFTGQLLHSGPALADIDCDSYDDIIIVSKGGECIIVKNDGTPLKGWPVTGLGSIVSEPQLINGDDTTAVILIANQAGDIYGLNTDGTERFMIDGSGSVKSSPAIYINNEEAYAFFATSTQNIYKIDLNNGSLDGAWPITLPSKIEQSLVISDLMVNSVLTPSIIALGNDGKLYAFDFDGNPVGGLFPLNTGTLSNSSPLLTDLDLDGNMEIITGNYFGISVIDIKDNIGNIYWPMHRGSPDRRGNVEYILTGLFEDGHLVGASFELMGNYPNPFNPSTSIRFQLPFSSPVELKIYSLSGKEIYHKNYDILNAGVNEFVLDMSNYASGIYIYSISAGEIAKSAKMILMK